MNVDILIVTYAGDADWIPWLLKSLRKFAKGFRRTILLFPTKDVPLFDEVLKPFPWVIRSPFYERPDGHLHHVVKKMQSDLISDADYIMHIDSDCVITDPMTPEDFFTEGRPDLVFTPYSAVQSPWGAVTERALGFHTPNETMRRFPFVYPRWLYKACREHIESVQGRPFEEFVFGATNIGGAWHSFCEFNALGGYAIEKHRGSFFLYNALNGTKPPHMKQYWSHHRTGPVMEELERLTEGWDK